jgi:hypothetical protein
MRETRTTLSVRNQSRMDTLMRGAASLEAVGPTRLQSLDLLRAIKILLERAIEENADKRPSSYEKIESAGFRSESKPQLDLGSRQTRVILEKLLEAKEADRLSPRYLQTLRGYSGNRLIFFSGNRICIGMRRRIGMQQRDVANRSCSRPSRWAVTAVSLRKSHRSRFFRSQWAIRGAWTEHFVDKYGCGHGFEYGERLQDA